MGRRLEVIIIIRKRCLSGLLHLSLVLSQEVLVNLHLSGRKRGSSDELLCIFVSCELSIRETKQPTYQSRVANQLPGEPKEGLLEVVIGLGRDVVILEVLLAVEGDGLGLHLALLDIDLVAAENDGNVLANTGQVT